MWCMVPAARGSFMAQAPARTSSKCSRLTPLVIHRRRALSRKSCLNSGVRLGRCCCTALIGDLAPTNTRDHSWEPFFFFMSHLLGYDQPRIESIKAKIGAKSIGGRKLVLVVT